MKIRIILTCVGILVVWAIRGQRVASSPEHIKALTSEWVGERSADGRPKISNALLKRLKNIQIEEAWVYLRRNNYHNQYEGDWQIIHPDSVMTGRVVTAQYMPLRPDFEQLVKIRGAMENRDTIGGSNSWRIEILQPGGICGR